VLVCQSLVAADSVSIRTNYYDVSGDSLSTIRDDIVQRRPWKEERDAETRWTIDWSFTTEDLGSVCRLQSLTIKTDITITMPRWNAAASEDDTLKGGWLRYFKLLAAHEEGHKQIALAAAKRVRQRLGQVRATADCAELERAVNREGKKAVDEFIEREKTYDLQTDHWRRQYGGPLPARR